MNLEEFKKLDLDQKIEAINALNASIVEQKNKWQDVEHFIRQVAARQQDLIELKNEGAVPDLQFIDKNDSTTCDPIRSNINAKSLMYILWVGATEVQRQINIKTDSLERELQSLLK